MNYIKPHSFDFLQCNHIVNIGIEKQTINNIDGIKIFTYNIFLKIQENINI